MITVASLRNRKTEIRGCCRLPEVDIVEPRRSCAAVFPLGDLWIPPGPWKTQTTRFPPPLGRRELRAAHRLHRSCDISLPEQENRIQSRATVTKEA